MASGAAASIGHRVFVIEGERVIRISQNVFRDFFERDQPALRQFAGKSIDLAIVFFTLDGRKPKEIVRMDTMRIKVTAVGAIDAAHRDEALRLVANAISWDESDAGSNPERGTVIDAKRQFDKRRYALHHPKLSGPIHKKILEELFK